MRRFYWLGTGPVPASCDLRRLGWESLEGRGLGSGAALAHVVGCTAHMAVRQWIELSAAAAHRRALTIVTGVNDGRQRVHLLASGIGDAVAAGSQLEELAWRAIRLVNQAAMLPAFRTVGPLRIDLLARDAQHKTRWLGLNPREFALLWRLADRPGQSAMPDDLLRDVWGLRFKPETNSLAVHICRLRSKLRIAGLDGAITTLADGSYRLDLGQPRQFGLDGRGALRKDDSKHQTSNWEQESYNAA